MRFIKLIHWYKIGVNTSRNFRIPTYNDLYWVGLGNPDLEPEISKQASLNHFLKFKKQCFQVAGFYIDTQDMIKWVPDSNGVVAASKFFAS